jgi:tRNA-dihydrouridine synthase
MRHFHPGAGIPTLRIEPFIPLRTVQNRLVAADIDGDRIERLDEFLAEAFALVVVVNGNIFDVADGAEVVDTIIIHGIKVSQQLYRYLCGIDQFLLGPV